MLKLAHIVAHQGSSFACAPVNSIWLWHFTLEARGTHFSAAEMTTK
jgi:hypothetical protein